MTRSSGDCEIKQLKVSGYDTYEARAPLFGTHQRNIGVDPDSVIPAVTERYISLNGKLLLI